MTLTNIKKHLILERAFIKSVLAIAVPVALQNAISFGVNMMDSVMLGRLGDTAISAAYLGTQPFTFLMATCFGLSSGGTVLIAQYWGKNDLTSIRKVMRMSMQLVFAISTLVTLLCLTFPAQIMGLFSGEQHVVAAATGYLSLIAFSYVPYAIANNYMMSLRAVEKVVISAVIYGISFFINVFFNAVFIFGLLGAPAMGVRGAAVGTIIARCSELVMVLIYMYKFERTVNFKIHHCTKFSKSILPSYMRHAMPVIGNEMLWSIGMLVTAAIMGWIGEVFVTAFSVANILNQLSFVAIVGVANAAAVLTGKTIGEGSAEKAKLVANSMIAFSFLVGLFNCAMILTARTPFLTLYDMTPAARDAAFAIMGVMAAIQLILCVDVTCIVGILRGGGDTHSAFLYDCGAVWLVSIPAGYIAGILLGLPVPFVFVCLKLDTIFKVVLSLIRIKSGKWIRNITIER